MSQIRHAAALLTQGRFYRRCSDGIAYRCERANAVRALLHIADLQELKGTQRRVIISVPDLPGWAAVPECDEPPLIGTYSRDAIAEHGADVGESGIIFRRQYHFDTYLDAIGDAEMRERLETIADNLFRYGSNGAVRLLTAEEGLEYWQRKGEEVIEQLHIRGDDSFFAKSPSQPGIKLLKLHHDRRQKRGYNQYRPWGRLPELPKRTERALFKYGKSVRLREALERGRLRVSPASHYSDPSLNHAQQDNHELKLLLRPSKTASRRIVIEQSGQVILDSSDHPFGQIAIVVGGDRDYFVWCCSKMYEPRLFVDFEADSCLVIHDHNEFAHRLNKGLLLKADYLPGMYANDVRYYDPVSLEDTLDGMIKEPLSIHFYKNFKYTYQTEYRFTWPLSEGRVLEPVDIEVGPLQDICDLIELK